MENRIVLFVITLLLINCTLSFAQTNTGKVGIGTANPQQTLHVKATDDPVRLEGLTEDSLGQDKYILVADTAGIVQKISLQTLQTLLEQSNGILKPQQFGAIAGDGNCDEAAFNLMFQQAVNKTYMVVIPPGDYDICSTIYLPKTTKSKVFSITGYGAILTANGVFTMFSRVPDSNADASQIIRNILIFEGLTMYGDNGGIGMHIGATYSAKITNCHFFWFDTGLITEFSLNGRYEGLRFTSCGDKAFVGTNGSWAGATLSNSAFNANRITDCRVFGKEGQSSHYEILAGDMNIIENCISEGRSPVNNVVIDSKNSTTVNHAVTMRNFWVESTGYAAQPGSTIIKLRNFKGYASFENVQSYKGAQPDTLLHFESGSAGGMIHIKGFRGSASLINNNSSIYGPYYIIDHASSTPDTKDDNGWLNGDYWVGGVVPKALNIEFRRSQNTGQTVISRWNTEVDSRFDN